jgi:hypothetical protein
MKLGRQSATRNNLLVIELPSAIFISLSPVWPYINVGACRNTQFVPMRSFLRVYWGLRLFPRILARRHRSRAPKTSRQRQGRPFNFHKLHHSRKHQPQGILRGDAPFARLVGAQVHRRLGSQLGEWNRRE